MPLLSSLAKLTENSILMVGPVLARWSTGTSIETQVRLPTRQGSPPIFSMVLFRVSAACAPSPRIGTARAIAIANPVMRIGSPRPMTFWVTYPATGTVATRACAAPGHWHTIDQYFHRPRESGSTPISTDGAFHLFQPQRDYGQPRRSAVIAER